MPFNSESDTQIVNFKGKRLTIDAVNRADSKTLTVQLVGRMGTKGRELQEITKQVV
jgi:hypothetical protein